MILSGVGPVLAVDGDPEDALVRAEVVGLAGRHGRRVLEVGDAVGPDSSPEQFGDVDARRPVGVSEEGLVPFADGREEVNLPD